MKQELGIELSTNPEHPLAPHHEIHIGKDPPVKQAPDALDGVLEHDRVRASAAVFGCALRRVLECLSTWTENAIS
jgi:hypothetical protein